MGSLGADVDGKRFLARANFYTRHSVTHFLFHEISLLQILYRLAFVENRLNPFTSNLIKLFLT